MASSPSTTRQRLDSWKEIAAFFGRDERTVNRWEKEKGLPVHRLPGTKGRVYAYAEELSAWLEASRSSIAVAADEIEIENDKPAIVAPDVPQKLMVMPASAPVENGDAVKPAGWNFRWSGAIRPLTVAAISVLAVLAVTIFYRSDFYHDQNHSGPGTGFDSRQKAMKHPAASAGGVVMASSPAHDPEAGQLYLKGRYYWNKRTPEDLNKALDLFMQAVVRDPNYAQAYMGMADCYNLLREYTLMPSSEAYPRALAAAKKAVELDDQSSEAHASLAFDLFYGMWDIAGGEREFRRAIDLNPNNAIAHHWYATALATLRRFPEALAEIDRAQALDPTSTSILADKGHLLVMAGREQEGVALLKQMEITEPSFLSPHRYLKDVYLTTGDYPNFLAESRKDAALVHDSSELAITVAAEKGFASGGGKGLLASMLQVQKQLYQRGHVAPSDLAETCALLGDKEAALLYLKASYDRREDSMLAVESYTAFNSLHNDPAYRDLIAKMNLPAEN